MDHVDQLERAHEHLALLVANLSDGQLTTPSPCAEWDVRALLNHVLGATRMFTLVNGGHQAGPDAGDLVGADRDGAVAKEARDNLDSWRRPGALDGDRTYPFGTFPAPGALLLNLTEVAVHAWDLAKASDQEPVIDADVATVLYDFWAPVPLDALRAAGTFGPHIDVDGAAPISDRLLGYLGRRS